MRLLLSNIILLILLILLFSCEKDYECTNTGRFVSVYDQQGNPLYGSLKFYKSYGPPLSDTISEDDLYQVYKFDLDPEYSMTSEGDGESSYWLEIDTGRYRIVQKNYLGKDCYVDTVIGDCINFYWSP